MRSVFPLMILAAMATACGDKDTQEPEDTNPPEDTEAVDECSPEALRDDALTNGEVIWDGVTLETATPIADILADTATYADQVLQIEGTAVEFCSMEGCWASLVDADGNSINLKVTDGQLDWRDHASLGHWLIGEGSFDPDGGHGPQVWITGAVIGTVICE